MAAEQQLDDALYGQKMLTISSQWIFMPSRLSSIDCGILLDRMEMVPNQPVK